MVVEKILQIRNKHERTHYYRSSYSLQYLHDLCVVWSPQIQRDEMESKPRTVLCDPDQLGNSVVRVHTSGSCQSDWLQRVWWSVHISSVKSDPGSNHTRGLCRILIDILQE